MCYFRISLATASIQCMKVTGWKVIHIVHLTYTLICSKHKLVYGSKQVLYKVQYCILYTERRVMERVVDFVCVAENILRKLFRNKNIQESKAHLKQIEIACTCNPSVRPSLS